MNKLQSTKRKRDAGLKKKKLESKRNMMSIRASSPQCGRDKSTSRNSGTPLIITLNLPISPKSGTIPKNRKPRSGTRSKVHSMSGNHMLKSNTAS